MQEGYFDYSQNDINTGCCLHCDDAEEGCLCIKCKCKKCYWYSPPEEYDEGKGHCDKIEVLKEERKEKLKKGYEEQSKKDYEKGKLLKKENQRKLNKIKERKEFPFYYTCQRCFREFVSERELKIILNKEPICDLCLNKLKIKNG